MTTNEKSKGTSWSWEENKAFEVTVAIHAEDRSDRWERIAAAVPGRTIAEIKHHYHRLVEDIRAIEGGLDPLPPYLPRKCAAHTGRFQGISNHVGKGSSRSNQERRKGIAWTEDEHRLFLLGLSKYGKGDWRSISRKFVVSRTPAQVASHAQKYFIRLESNKRRRSSIHDITNVGNEDISAPQESIIDQSNGPIGATGVSIKQSRQPPSSTFGGSMNSNKRRRSSIYDITGVGNGDILVPQAPITSQPNGPTGEHSSPPPSRTFGVSMYGPLTIGQPIGESLVSAIGTPVPAPPHMAYDVGAPYRWDHCSWCPNEHSSNDISNAHVTED